MSDPNFRVQNCKDTLFGFLLRSFGVSVDCGWCQNRALTLGSIGARDVVTTATIIPFSLDIRNLVICDEAV